MHLANTLLTLATLSISNISATQTLSPFGLADPVANLVARSSGTPSSGDPRLHCDSTQLNKICGPNFLDTFESKSPNITAPCKTEISEAQTYVCNYWKSGNVTESCAAVTNAWTRVKADKCLPEGGHHGHHGHKKCDEKKLAHICQGDFLTKFETKANLTDTCKESVNGAWNDVCNEWKGNANVTSACVAVKTEFKDLKTQGCRPAGSWHHHGDQEGGEDGGASSS